MARSATLRIHEPGPRQFVNEMLGDRAFERGDALALHRPLEVHLQLSSGCNLDCYMCHEHLRPEGTRHGKGLQFLAAPVLERIEREVLPYSTRLHLGVGGEPMLAPDFLGVVERAHARNQRIHLTTNGTRIATERVAEVLARCVHEIEISIDGATAGTYERIRGGASFARLTRNIELLNKHRLLYGAEERSRLTLCMVLMKSNVHELPLLVELAKALSADGVSAWPVIPVTAEGRADALDLELARPSFVEARERARAANIDLDLPFDHGAPVAEAAREDRSAALRRLARLEEAGRGRTPGRHYCHMPTVALYVFWDGRVYPCANPEVHQGEPLGDLTVQDFGAIWNGRRLRNLRAGLAQGETPAVCLRCPILHRTAGPAPDASSDLVSRFGERDLAPAPAGEALGLVDQAFASGLAEHVHERYFKLLGYSHLLEREVHALSSDGERLVHERDSARLHLGALIEERSQLKAHAETLARDRAALAGHAATLAEHVRHLEAGLASLMGYVPALESEVRRLEGEADRLGHERDAERARLADGLAALSGYVPRLEVEVRRLEGECNRLGHEGAAAKLQREAVEHQRGGLVEHADTLARERKALARHAATLEAEREHLVRHVATLERILERTRARAVHRALSSFKDFLVRPRPRAPFSYVPPWVADGTRRQGEPPARLDP